VACLVPRADAPSARHHAVSLTGRLFPVAPSICPLPPSNRAQAYERALASVSGAVGDRQPEGVCRRDVPRVRGKRDPVSLSSETGALRPQNIRVGSHVRGLVPLCAQIPSCLDFASAQLKLQPPQPGLRFYTPHVYSLKTRFGDRHLRIVWCCCCNRQLEGDRYLCAPPLLRAPGISLLPAPCAAL